MKREMPGNAGHFFAPDKPLIADVIREIELQPLLLSVEISCYAR
jgi:hypothetical protein